MTSMACQALRERFPEWAARRENPSPTEAAHLLECPECHEEWRLIQASAALGATAARTIDPERVARRVGERLQADPVVRRRGGPWWAVGLIAAAAAIALLVWSGPGPGTPVDERPVVEVLPELDQLQTTELTTILETFGGPVGDQPTMEAPGLEDLSADELTRVLDTWEG